MAGKKVSRLENENKEVAERHIDIKKRDYRIPSEVLYASKSGNGGGVAS